MGGTSVAAASTVTYTGPSGGAWETASNWSGGVVPTSTDDVVIDTGVVVGINRGTTVNSLTLGVSAGGVTSTLDFNYDASSSPLTTIGNLVLYGSSTITQTAGSTSTVLSRINLDVGGSAVISGSINANYDGYQYGNGPGAGTAYIGASYGGIGGGNTATSTYGSLQTPTDLGSGAIDGNNGCNGDPDRII